MAKEGLFAMLCAMVCAALVLGDPADQKAARSAADSDSDVSAALAVQLAMQQGHQFLAKRDSRAAVLALESQLSKINGKTDYLALLRDAYRAYVRDLRLAGQTAEAERYLKRLQMIDPGAALDLATVRGANAPSMPATTQKTPAALPASENKSSSDSSAKTAAKGPAAPSRPEPASKISREEDNPFRPSAAEKGKAARSLLARADDEFNKHCFKEASMLYEQAHRSDSASVAETQKGKWAYCKVHRVVEQLNRSSGTAGLDDFEKEVRQALELAPKLDYSKEVLSDIERRRKEASGPPVSVRHFERGNTSWSRAETSNFRTFHNQSRELAEQAAVVAEHTRTEMIRKWFGGDSTDWDPRCDLYLYATAQEYCRATNVATDSPGHSSIRSDGPRVLSRRIDLHCKDSRNMLHAILPHETTHVVLAGRFGDKPVPRWADEGMAVLTEPGEKIDRHLQNLARCRQDNELFSLRQLMQSAEYPKQRYITAFYAQSVAVVDYLTREKGPQVFTQFLREALKTGYEPALDRHYGIKGFDDLQKRWTQKAFPPSKMAQH